MTDYTKLVADLHDIEKTMFALGTSPINMDNVSIRLAYDKRWGTTANDAADAIEALQAENPIVETVLVDKLRQRIDELEEKQTYCDAYGDKWMTSGKDVPTEAYKHGYADGWDEAMAKMEVQDESVF